MANDLNRSVKIYIDNTDAKLKADELRNTVQALRSELERLSITNGKDSDAYKKKEKAYNAATKSLNTYEKKVKDTERVLKNLSRATYDELIKAKSELTKALRKAERGTDDYRNKLLLLRQTNKQIAVVTEEMRGAVGRQGDAWCRAADFFNKYIGLLAAGIAAITGLSMKFRQLSSDVAKMDDKYSDVMKTTGMTYDQVKDLNEEFKKMDTRTAREELNNLARDAGKLGISGKKNILDFVEAGNQINVALGEDLGEGAIKNIGKMVNVLQESSKELQGLDLKEQMLAAGSAVNALGQASTASEPYLVAFTGRMGGVAKQAGISMSAILGYASSLDQDMQAVEMSATALQKFIMSIMSNPAKFAKIAGKEVKEFSNLLKTDANEAIIQVLKALNGKGGFQELIPIFKDMGLDGARAVGVLSSMAGSIKQVEEAQKLASKAMLEGTSITNEYNIKNNNLQAQLEKKQKAFKDAALELGERLNPVLLKSTSAMTYFIKLLPSMIDFFAKYGKYMLYAVTIGTAYVAGVKLQTLWTNNLSKALSLANIQLKLKSIWLTSLRIVVLSYNLLIAIFTRNTFAAGMAMAMLNKTIKTNPLGLFLSILAAVTLGIYELTKRTNSSVTAVKALVAAEKELNPELYKEQAYVKDLFNAYRTTNSQSEEHRKIRETIMEKYGSYLKGLIDEKGEITDIGKALEIVNDKLRQQIALKIRNAASDTIMEDNIKTQKNIVDDMMGLIDKQLPGKESSNVVRKKINQLITSLADGADHSVDELRARLSNTLSQDFRVDINKGGGIFRKNIDTFIAQLANKVKEGNKKLREVRSQYDGMIDELTNIESLTNTTNATNTTSSSPDVPEAKEKEVKAALDIRLKALENSYRERQLIIEKNDEKEWETEAEKQLLLSNAEYDYLQNRIKLLKNFQTSHAKLSGEVSNQRLEDEIKVQKNQRKFEENIFEAYLQDEKKKLDIIQASYDRESSELKVQYNNRQITKEQYDARLLLLDYNTASARLQLHRATETAMANEVVTNEDVKVEAVKKAGKAVLSAERDTKEKLSTLNKNYFESEKSLLEQYGKISIEQQKQQELDRIHAMRNHTRKDESGNDIANPLISAEAAKIAELAIEKKYEDEKLKVRTEYGIANMAEIHQSELDALREKLEKELLTEEEYAEARTQLKLKHAAEYAQKAGEFTQSGANAVQALEEAETAKISAEYTKRQSALTEQFNQGLISEEEYKKQKEQLDYEQKVEELNTQKKYADANFALQVSQIIASTSLAAMQAYSAMAGIPIVGPALGAVAAGLAIVAGGAQIVKAKAERDRVKSLTIEAPGGSDSAAAVPTGARVLNQAEKGKYDVIGADDGKLYKNVPYVGYPQTGVITQPTIVAENGSELIVSSPDLKRLEKHINYPLVISAINDARNGTVPQRAKGNYDSIPEKTPVQSPDTMAMLHTILLEIRDFLKDLKSGVNIKARASVALTDLKAAQDLEEKANNIFTKGN